MVWAAQRQAHHAAPVAAVVTLDGEATHRVHRVLEGVAHVAEQEAEGRVALAEADEGNDEVEAEACRRCSARARGGRSSGDRSPSGTRRRARSGRRTRRVRSSTARAGRRGPSSSSGCTCRCAPRARSVRALDPEGLEEATARMQRRAWGVQRQLAVLPGRHARYEAHAGVVGCAGEGLGAGRRLASEKRVGGAPIHHFSHSVLRSVRMKPM